MTRLLHCLACASVLAVTAACSTSPTSSDTSDGGAGGEPSGATGGTDGSLAVRCPAGTNPKSDTTEVLVGLVTGQIVDEHGEPTSAGLVQVCGKNVCIPARVTDNGVLAESVNQKLNAPACKFGDGLTWGKLAMPISAGDSELGTLMTARLPAFADGVAFTPGKAIASGGVTLTLAADAHVEFDILNYEDEAQRGFRAASLPEQAVTQLAQGFVAGWVLSPVETVICPSPAVSLENATQLAPGALLELFILGVDVSEEWAPYGGWQKVGEGQVSDDGATLEFPGGVPLLTAIGVREKR